MVRGKPAAHTTTISVSAVGEMERGDGEEIYVATCKYGRMGSYVTKMFYKS